MRLTRLDISGFKSFAKKTELCFGNGITAVVGPNGSGKSNIADAVRWVLGEQSAKALRGSKMEDVIFNGTQTRKAQSMCEVTLTFENADRKLPTDYAEVAVTRRMYRSGESEYCLNGKTCRLKDILELFRDTGIGKDGYSIIGQGKVDEILSNKSGDRRTALEEAAGVMRYRARKEEAERKLENTEKNMERIADVLEELGARIGPLEEQSVTARTFLKLREELKDLEVNLFLYQTDKQKAQLVTVAETIEALEQELAVAAESERTLSVRSQELEEQVRDLDTRLSEQQNSIIGMLSGVEAHVGESNVLMERREHSQKEIVRIQTERESLQAQQTELESSLRSVVLCEEDRKLRQTLDASIAAETEALETMDAELLQRERLLDEKKTALMDAMNRLSDARSDLSRFDTMRTVLSERMTALDGEEKQAEVRIAALQQELQAARAVQTGVAERFNELVASRKEAQKNRYALESDYLAAQAELKIAEQNVGAISSREHVVREMVRSREGYQNSVRSLMQAAQKDDKLHRCIIGPVAELLHVPGEYETAIGMSLGGSLQNIVTSSAEDAKYIIEYLRKQDLGRVTLLPLSMLTPNPLNDREREFLNSEGVIGLAYELIEYDPKLATVAEFLLGRTVVVRDLDSAIALKKRSRNAFHIVTLLGDYLATGGTMTGGSLKKQSFSLLGRERELKELVEQLETAKRTVTEKQKQVDVLKQQILLAETQIDSFVAEAHAAELELVKQGEQYEIIQRDLNDAMEAKEELSEERQDISDSLADLQERKQLSEQTQTEIEQNNVALRDEIRAESASLAERKTERERRMAELSEQKIRRMALTKEDDAREAERHRLQRSLALNAQRIESFAAEIRSLNDAVSAANARLSEMERSIEGEQEELNAAKEQQVRLENERNKANDQLRDLRRERDSLGETYRQLGDRKHRNELMKNRIEMECQRLSERIFDEYELTYENALPMRREIPISASNQRVAALKTEIRGLGDINISAIEDYRTVSERHDNLKTQYEDLVRAKTDLYTLIGELTRTMERVFSEEFRKIQANFSTVFEQLFGGGHAELRLSDKNDVLNCEIDIIAQPPGKKLQLLSLLSGGERALTAIALLFAMLQLKAPAFCVLDEIETSLDEANVSKFAGYLKEYSDETQFIIITHRKGSMEVCDTLYGVAMQEKGISGIVSARFSETA